MIEKREWTFRVSCTVDPGERVFVVGSCAELGSWNLTCPLPLDVDDDCDSECNEGEIIWTKTVTLPSCKLEYRYCVCSTVKSSEHVSPFYSVQRWETSLKMRIIPKHDLNSVSGGSLEKFGFIGSTSRVDQGWLTRETVVQLKLYNSKIHSEPVVLWNKRYTGKKCFVKATPIDLTEKRTELVKDNLTDESTEAELTVLRMQGKSSWPLIEVAALNDDQPTFHFQDQFGVQCMNDDFVIFQCHMMEPNNVGFLMDYYMEMEEGEIPRYIGCSFILPSNMKETFGVATLPISSPKHMPIGQLTVHYLVVNPLGDSPCDMRVSYAKHWKACWRGLEVGHRGAGNSYHHQSTGLASIRENTIASLKYACENGADMVEFDVQLSRDHIPVLYHEFHACIALRCKKDQSQTDLLQIPIKDLSLDQLQKLRVHHPKEEGLNPFGDEDQEDHQPFPTLSKVFESVPISCGFNVELKWTMRNMDGSYELEHPIELNKFLDIIIKDVLENAKSRKIIFSCFHPDICTMIRLKQNRYPVLFLTNAREHCYEDLRTSSIEKAVRYATSADILGINFDTAPMLSNPAPIELAFKHNLVLFCYGDANNDKDTIVALKQMGIHGIIYDKIDEHNTNGNKPNVFWCDDQLDTCNCPEKPHNRGDLSSGAESDAEKDSDPECKNLNEKRKSKHINANKKEPPSKKLCNDSKPLTTFQGALS